MALERMDLLAQLCIPYLDGTISRARGYTAAIWRKRDRVAMALERTDLLARLCIPYLDGTIGRARGDTAAIRRKRNRLNRAAMALERLKT